MEASPREMRVIAASIVAALVPAWETNRCGDGKSSASDLNAQSVVQSSESDPLLDELMGLMRRRLLLMRVSPRTTLPLSSTASSET